MFAQATAQSVWAVQYSATCAVLLMKRTPLHPVRLAERCAVHDKKPGEPV